MPLTTSSPDSDGRDSEVRVALCKQLGYSFDDDDLLDLSLRHRSWCSENGGLASNERLEFLGDAVLGVVVTDHLFRSAPDMSEGVLARHRSELVSATALAAVAREISLGDAIMLGKGEESTGGREKTSILADGMEAVIGAVYLDAGIDGATELVLDLLEERIDEVLAGDLASDHKSRLQEYAAHRFGHLPRYTITEDGPEHEKYFTATVELGGDERGRGGGRTKKEAEQAAAHAAFDRLLESDAAGSTARPAPGPVPTEQTDPAQIPTEQIPTSQIPTAQNPATPASTSHAESDDEGIASEPTVSTQRGDHA